MHIRDEEDRDRAAVYAVNAAAFETPAEARLVEALRARASRRVARRGGEGEAARFGPGCPYDVPDDVFMALELRPGRLHGVSGAIAYHAAFDAL